MPDEQIEEQQPIVNILDPKMKEEVDITLTKGQALFIFKILEQNIQPRGLEMVEFAYDLMKRFDSVRNLLEETEETMVDDDEEDPFTTETPKVHDMSPKKPLGE
tara:strand:- start:463 stop:774 length:312 start_codon:yes stop_codon:yes gene_type:complete